MNCPTTAVAMMTGDSAMTPRTMKRKCSRFATGSHRATWTCPSGFKASDCTMVARAHESDVSSGNDYMIVNITNGVVTHEDL